MTIRADARQAPYPRDSDPLAHGWTQLGEVTAADHRLSAGQAVELELAEGAPAFRVARLHQHVETGARVLHRTVLPLERIAGTTLADAPTMPQDKAQHALTKAHGPIEWYISVSVRMPEPVETAVLGLTEPGPLLITERVVYASKNRRPLTLECTTALADAIRYTYRLTPEPLSAYGRRAVSPARPGGR